MSERIVMPRPSNRVKTNELVSYASESSVMECSSESAKRKKTTPWCDDEPECVSAVESKKMRRSDNGETCQTFGKYPEYTMPANAGHLFKVIRELIPLKAETIKVADRRIIRDTADQLMEELVQMAGVVKEHRHTIARNDAEVKETKENTTKEVLFLRTKC
ncbi:uncharacterized protein LOC112905138 isoform X6 [Agrilus planipennis]|uniref:Uncharacterized protein LOC112905138 isoform X6 n=1 Tax=Agrilus planipennis TaxID=224129 RepID=A0A7F5R9U7_AGRPL|nr:uncharacterized protein LOC112905138 isoform X6 [Agrilus planipennis]